MIDYNNLPKVDFKTQKELDIILDTFKDIRENLIKETLESFLLNIEYDENKDDTNIYNKLLFNNYLVPGIVKNLPNHMGLDEGIALRYGLGSLWIRSVCEVAKWYEYNIDTLQTSTEYECDLFPGRLTVFDNHKSFFNACILMLAVKTKPEIYAQYKDKEIDFNELDTDGECADMMRSLGFELEYIDSPDSIYHGYEYEQQGVLFGDIVVKVNKQKTGGYAEIFFSEQDEIEYDGGTITEWTVGAAKTNLAAMNWNEIHDNDKAHYGMPCPIKPESYNVIWRYTGI